MDTEPVAFHELHPADDRTVGRVHLVYLNSLTVATGDEVRLDLAVAETGQHSGVLARLSLQDSLLLAKVQSLDDDRFTDLTGVLHDTRHSIANDTKASAW